MEDKRTLVEWMTVNSDFFFEGKGSKKDKFSACLKDAVFSQVFTAKNLQYQWEKLESEYKEKRNVKKTTDAGLHDEQREQGIENLDGTSSSVKYSNK
jgi:hypothetical protein